ncbi:Mbeg1-like protein [Vaginisenegalia massiliensis]|uniref:Mbeg1-like protein n=1 Tax=Vaginisenegalia massiliensis TaxID=2058294 RepID=UPI000F5473B2|nr:Mbeg1-like protein [Vaginisenegalia massiliensis]
MATCVDYLMKFRNIPFEEEPMNEIDRLILNEILYLPIDSLVTSSFDPEEGLSPEQLCQKFYQHFPDAKPLKKLMFTPSRLRLLKLMQSATRYQDLILLGFHQQFNPDINQQFAAALWLLPQIKEIQVVFRGTDDTIIGWKEDLMMSYQEPVPAQIASAFYLKAVFHQYSTYRYYITGHSKGGNLAIYASAMQSRSFHQQLIQVSAYDGPGFHESFLNSQGYQHILSKIQLFIPQDSVVGKMLVHRTPYIIVKSKAFGLHQHFATNWLVDNHHFIQIPFSSSFSQTVDWVIKTWANDYTGDDLAFFVETSFYALLATGAVSLDEFSNDLRYYLSKIRQASNQLNPTDKHRYETMLNHLLRLTLKKIRQNRKEKLSILKDSLQIKWFKHPPL